jgi:hypothetical protein
VFADPLVTPDFEVGVDINLGNPNNEFGLLFRAKGPDNLVAGAAAGVVVDQIKINSFYFAVVRADRVELQKLVEGTPTRLKSLSIPPKTVFRLAVRALGDQIRVLRDGEEILAHSDGTLTGKHVGVVGLKSEGEPVRFKRFSARGYGGEFQIRSYAASLLQYRGPNVHHNPLYFEQRGLERHGHHLGNLAQPFISHGLFLVDAGLWPMSIMTTKPWECLSGDLYARPGDLVPFQLTPPAVSAQGVALEIGVIAAFAAMVP